MKKIIGGVLAAVAIFVPAVSFAATLNNDPQDFATLRVTNYTANPTCVTCWSGSTTANNGDVVSFSVYYHNTGVDTARNVRVKLSPQSTPLGTTHSFTATITADNAPTVSGTVTVNTPSGQTMSALPNGVIWRANQTTYGSTALPAGQTTSNLFDGVGLNLGNIAPGWPTQGSLVVRFQASPAASVNTNTNTNTNTNNFLPSVTTSGVSSVSQNSATLSGYVSSNGSNTNAWFEWGTTWSLGNTTPNVSYGNTATNFSNTLYGLSANTTYYYRAVAQNAQGIVQGSIMSFTTSGSVWNNWSALASVSTRNADVSTNFASLNGYVDPNGTSDTVRWFEWGSTTNFGNSTAAISHGSVASNFSASVTGLTANTTYYYRAVARNAQGTVYGNMLSFTTAGQTYNYSYNTYTGTAPTVTTLLATELTGTTAKLNGLVFTSENISSNTWFEWGTNTSLGNKTQSINAGALPVVKHSDFISGLTNGQTYYYRIVAQNTYGTSYGTVNSFVAEVGTYVAPVVSTPIVLKPTTTVISRGSGVTSQVALSIEGGEEMIGSGEKRTYRVTWKNQSGQNLKNVVLRVTFPAAMNIDSATKGAFSAADNSVVVDLKTLTPNESGDAFIFATTDRGIKAGQLLVITANMVYTNANGVQGDVIAYLTHRAEMAQGALGASVFGAGEFIPTTLFEWVLLLILVLVLVLLGNHLYGRLSGAGTAHH